MLKRTRSAVTRIARIRNKATGAGDFKSTPTSARFVFSPFGVPAFVCACVLYVCVRACVLRACARACMLAYVLAIVCMHACV